MMLKPLITAAITPLFFLASPAMCDPAHGLGLYGPDDLKLAEDDPFPYVNPAAPKGGTLVMQSDNFTTLNQFALKGLPAPLLSLIFESPTIKSHAENEPFSTYGHLVKTIDLAEDRLSLTYSIRPEAAFSDGRPVRADDFVFSFDIMSDPEYNPRFKQYFADVDRAEKLDDLTVRFHFKRPNQELPLILGELGILPKHIYGGEGKVFGKDFDQIAIGSGPYVVEACEFGKFITVRRNPDWWAKDLPKSQGMYNFDRITAKVYLDDVARKEAFKGGQYDILYVTSSKDWALDFSGPFVKKNYIVRREIPHQRPMGMQGFGFNLRRDVFSSLKTRFALAMAMDFDWMNRNLFYDQYQRANCFYGNSPDMTNLDPPGPDMAAYLHQLRLTHGAEAVPKMALSKGLRAPGEGLAPGIAAKQAEILLESVDWRLRPDGIRARNGQRLSFELLLHSKTWERIAEPYQQRLRSLGVDMRVTTLQPAEYEKRVRAFDYDMIVIGYGQSDSIGNEQLDYFGSQAADTPGSWNFTGLKNPAVDAVLSELVTAKSRRELVFHGQALDRLLMANCILVPHWNVPVDRTLYWNKFGMPEKHCSKVYPTTAAMHFWWIDPAKLEALRQARATGAPLP
ncbi:MAG: extracellular solute-binding protein [Lentisphaeria bacterium]|nr:extracellular solute-binding protein [Lentisphaeria bacterium]